MTFRVYLRQRGRTRRTRVEVMAPSEAVASDMAIGKVIAQIHPGTRRVDWIVTSVEMLA